MTAELLEAPPSACHTCGNRRWTPAPDGSGPAPCTGCKPYGARIHGKSVHPNGARVRNPLIDRSGTVLRAWKPTQGEKRPGRYTYCDVQYADGLLAIAWEYDLERAP